MAAPVDVGLDEAAGWFWAIYFSTSAKVTWKNGGLVRVHPPKSRPWFRLMIYNKIAQIDGDFVRFDREDKKSGVSCVKTPWVCSRYVLFFECV